MYIHASNLSHSVSGVCAKNFEKQFVRILNDYAREQGFMVDKYPLTFVR